MKLYHGTSAKALASIRSKGLLPRLQLSKKKKNGNWEHTVCSRPDCVYLTSVYAPFFAINASGDDNHFVIVEVDTDYLEYDLLLPDEDFLEQATRGQESKGSMKERTEYFRDNLFLFSEHWDDSIKHMGTCCYQDRIDPSAITRAVRVDGERCQFMLSVAMDPIISILNHKFCSAKYVALTRWFMGDEAQPQDIFSFGNEHWKLLPEEQREYFQQMMSDRSMIDKVM